MKDRIKQIRKDSALTQQDFADSLDLSRNFIAQCETGDKFPSDRTIRDICRVYNVNEEWLREGTGEPYRALSMNQQIAERINNIMGLDDEDFKKRLINVLCELDDGGWKLLEKIALDLTKKE